MNIQLEWLKQYVDFDQSAEEIAHLLTMSGLEMEGMEEVELPDGTKTPVLELNVTPNRGYCLSHIGVARELAALLDQSLRLPNPPEESNKKSEQATVSERIKVENEDASLCPRYAAMMIENVTPGPSPKWLSDRLHAVGLRPINNIVDITNFVLMEFGQPLHAFDFDKLAGRRIVVRRAKKGERFTSLTGVELKLDTDALVIADAEKPVALAGIMGGANSEVTESTKTVVLESAFFDPVVVRKGSKKYGLRTDSSYRFERRVDIEAVITAQTRAAHLIQEIAGGKIVPDRIDIYPKPFARSKVRLRISRVNQILGTALEAEKILGYLRKMGLHIQEQKSAEEYQVEIPTCYPNLTREADLIEEVARLNGFENIGVTRPAAHVNPVRFTPRQKAGREARGTLSHLGYSENVNYGFIEEEMARQFESVYGNSETEPVPLDNPLSNDMSTMRTSLLPGLIKSAARNINKGQKPVKLFEVGNIYLRGKNDRAIIEKASLAILVAGPYEPSVWKDNNRSYDYYDLKGALETVVSQFKLTPEFKNCNRTFLNPGKSVDCLVREQTIGFCGELLPSLARKWDIEQNVYFAEIDLDRMVSLIPESVRFVPIPKFPETYRDISILVNQSVKSQTITDLIRKTSQPIIRKVELYDHFEGKKLEQGKKSLTYALSFQSPERTLTDEEVNPVFDKIVKALSEELGASLRS